MTSQLPSWFRQEIPDREVLENMRTFSENNVHTVCQEAHCPNITRCFKSNSFTFMILGNACTRNCAFCAVNKDRGEKLFLDQEEPERICHIVERFKLDYVVITSVTRDDLEDGGAVHFARTIKLIHGLNTGIAVEALIPDFQGKIESLKFLLASGPLVLAHNLETVKRLYCNLRPEADYKLSLDLLSIVKKISPGILTKSSIMLGLGEIESEILEAMRDLRIADCDLLVLGQYLAPSALHYPVREFISLKQFKKYEDMAVGMGFKAVLSGPLVRSSYRAKETYRGILCMI